ncbi:hypothetical protein [Paremcibacter congregatus]|uniref:DUF2007 domain-containing protein n=1 Tax=Paremcibacter congregatus TaxID=2043170 RepID=A0A2G4YPR0_9PROT|nr:hypothetical protein [Paremcibacter congregatus]PHZ84323.1 hypothetical protein CRD36_10925 [Paremcibacter congregatus]QDE28542.1 hypothetical protein FIV45_15335 [Paremcibacter congregatus]
MGTEIVRYYSSVNEARIARGYLESHGITAWLRDAHIIEQQWYYTTTIGDVKLCVLAPDRAAADCLLADIEQRYHKSIAHQCPTCSSAKLTRYRRYTEKQFSVLGILALLFPILLPFYVPPMKYGFVRCLQCQADFYDDLQGGALRPVGGPLVTIPRLVFVYLLLMAGRYL